MKDKTFLYLIQGIVLVLTGEKQIFLSKLLPKRTQHAVFYMNVDNALSSRARDNTCPLWTLQTWFTADTLSPHQLSTASLSTAVHHAGPVKPASSPHGTPFWGSDVETWIHPTSQLELRGAFAFPSACHAMA